ncbi:MAG: hypothetical protein KF850_02990 [Labilithrix sp.]|nr:hypothetical protein [Labilithrix sp.]
MAGASAAGRLTTFQSLATLRILNILAVAASLAGATGVVLGRVFGRWYQRTDAFAEKAEVVDEFVFSRFSGTNALLTAATTFAFGLCWALLLRSRATTQDGRRRGWLQAIPLALANSATAYGLVRALEHGPGGVVVGALIGATLGAICWIPALIATLVCFGLPIAWSQRLAKKGLAGEERGEIIVGVVSALVALVAIALIVPVRASNATLPPKEQLLEWSGYLVVLGLSLIGAATGAGAAMFAYRREKARRVFVREVEAGAVEGFRIDASDEGKVLIRITSMGQGYRVANFEEPIVGLDESGEVQRALALEPVRTPDPGRWAP